jgi:2-amino-4-hydroxy-6-hydroxymethyldihydropteridine diphosphokinase
MSSAITIDWLDDGECTYHWVGWQVVQQSRLYETAPAYVVDQPAFLNMALIAATDLQPVPLLRTLKHVEVGTRTCMH